MIEDEQYPSFKFDGDDDEPDSEQEIYREDSKERRVEKLSHRVTIISILLPVIIGVVVYITYRDIASRVSQDRDTGAMEIQNLSTQLQENLAALSTKSADLEAALDQKLAALDQKLGALDQKLAALEKVDKTMKANLKKANATVNRIKATKADKKDQKNAIAKINAAVTPLHKELKDLKAVTADLQVLDNQIKQQLSAISANMDKSLKELAKIQTDLISLSNQKLNKDTLQLELLKAKKNFQKDLDVTKLSIDKRLASMLRKIKDLEKLAQAPLETPRSSGGIIEQEINE